MSNLPGGTVAFLFTDIEGSTRNWENDRPGMSAALRDHDRLLRETMLRHHGYVFKTIGDAFCVAFASVSDALDAALEGQRVLRDHAWNQIGPLRVRMAIHCGDPESRDDDYFGPPVNRVARLLSAGHGEQILLSGSAYALARYALPPDVQMKDHGERRLKDLQVPEQIYQVLAEDLRAAFPPLKTLDELPNNLPSQLTEFIGRETEIEKVCGLLKPKHLVTLPGVGPAPAVLPENGPPKKPKRLVTLQGAGGCGKTRLALQVGAELLDEYEQGVWFVSLGELNSPALVPQTVARVLKVEEKPNCSYLESLIERLRSQELLLILDNCEHLHLECEELAAALLRACPNLSILATSRQTLGVMGDVKFAVPPMRLPPPVARYDAGTLAKLEQCESAQLFVECARAFESDFTITPENAPALARICLRVEGVPFAIILAASALRSMTVQEIAEQDIFRLPPPRGGSILRHQRTMRTMLDFSYDLLADSAKTMLRHLWVFEGGCTLQAARALHPNPETEDWEVLETLTELIEASLLQKETHGDVTRYRLSETTRSYLQNILLSPGEVENLRHRHLDYFLTLTEQEEPKLRGAQQAATLERLAADHDNLRAALKWADRDEKQARIANSLWRFWMLRGYFSEGREWLKTALAIPNLPDAVRAKALIGAGVLTMRQSDYGAASVFLEESLAIGRRIENPLLEAEALNNLGQIARDHGDLTLARSLYEQSLSKWQETSDSWGTAAILNNLGMVMRDMGAPNAAHSYYLRFLELSQELGDSAQTGIALSNLGMLAYEQQDFTGALDYFEQSLARFEIIGYKMGMAIALSNIAEAHYGLGDFEAAEAYCKNGLRSRAEIGGRSGFAYPLDTLAKIACKRERQTHAVTLYAMAATLREMFQTPMPEAQQEEINADIAQARAKMDEATFVTAWKQGQEMPIERIVEYAAGSFAS